MKQRPPSVLVVGILVILLGALGLLGDVLWYSLKDTPQFQAAAAKMPPTMPLDFVLGAINSAVLMACGIGFLLRQGWMRYLMLVMVLLMFFYENFRLNPRREYLQRAFVVCVYAQGSRLVWRSSQSNALNPRRHRRSSETNRPREGRFFMTWFAA